ncbi:hypothetical protein [Haliangium sp.]|uniref:hypothetical protein n=1 Tax=Haliangium sp. TaxID=2663208 RepID=UPI003D1021BF
MQPEALLATAAQYYPEGIENYAPAYRDSVEFQRLSEVLARSRRLASDSPAEHPWGGFCELLGREFDGCSVWNNHEERYDPCHGCRVYLPWVTPGRDVAHAECVVVLVSLLAPVYALYASRASAWVRLAEFPARFVEHEARLAALVEAEFGYTRVPAPTLAMAVPDRVPPDASLNLGEAALIDLLFTPDRW